MENNEIDFKFNKNNYEIMNDKTKNGINYDFLTDRFKNKSIKGEHNIMI